ncbi:unnamed protein product [Haemonchus placei]|uniref:Uncharacterized protein n=1 Tax=Haemonchus placei TaxID=6290 RepID=A0A158QQW6_HAEPC|nr:unnamed protein product [Haemonchus placei]
MACVAVHSHLLVSLLTIYGTIILLLLVSGSWDMSTKSKTTSGEDTFNVEGFKIITIMVFNAIFNIGACIGLWLHKAPKYPDGYSRAVRGGAVLSTITLVFTLVIASLFCCRYPAHSSQKPPSSAVVLVAHTPKEGDEKGSKEATKERKRLSAENKKSDKEGKKKSGSKQKDESEEPKKGSKEAISGSKSAQEALSGVKPLVAGDKIGTREEEKKALKSDKTQRTTPISVRKDPSNQPLKKDEKGSKEQQQQQQQKQKVDTDEEQDLWLAQ